MKYHICLFIAVLLTVVCTMKTVAQNPSSKPYELLLENQERPMTAKSGTTYVVLVSHNIFERNPVHIAEYSDNDVQAIKKWFLQKTIPQENVAALTSARKEFYLRPTRENILAMIQSVARSAGKNDSLFVLIGGIGSQVDGETCFLADGATLANGKHWISETEIRDCLLESAAKKSILFMLVNRLPNKAVSSDEIVRRPLPEMIVPLTDIPKHEFVHITVNSCSENGFADESTGSQNDLFLATLLTLAKERELSIVNDLATLFPLAKEIVLEKTTDREGGLQVPQMRLWHSRK